MSEPLDELYFKWLYEQVANPDFKQQDLTYWKILKVLFEKEFVWIVPNDENRVKDAKYMRIKFLEMRSISDFDPEWMELGCSVLELMVGLSRKLEFLADGEPHYWFWVMMENLGLSGYNDKSVIPRHYVDDTLNTFVSRTYEENGLGGLFPLTNPRYDQRERELWYQANDYVEELELAR